MAENAASRSELTPFARHALSRVIRFVVSPTRRGIVSGVRELARRATRAPHRVHYFHQPDDPYSHLAVQALGELRERYAIEVVPRVAGPDGGPNQPEPELLAALARRDCALVAPHYGLAFPDAPVAPAPESLRSAERALVAALASGPDSFIEVAVEVGRALWSGDPGALESVEKLPAATESGAAEALAASAALRRKWGHYSGAMFLYAGEWYWGVDRLHHLERRLETLGAERVDGIRFDRPPIPMDPVPRASELTLEVFPSLRSPYTAIGFERTVELAERTGVALVTRPVLPMVMRGVPVTFSKGMYIMLDTHREAELMDVPFGRMVDPIGEPVRRGYSLWPWARDHGRGNELLASFLRCAFCEGVDAGTEVGLRRIVEEAGLPWEEAREQLGDAAWEDELEANRVAMIEELGQWGVPSFRLRGPAGEPDLACWGQDRLWLVAREIQRRGA